MNPIDTYYAEQHITVADDLNLYLVAADDPVQVRYRAELYEGDLGAAADDTAADDAINVYDDVSGESLYDVALQVVKQMRLRYEDDTLPAVNLTPEPYLDTYRPLEAEEEEQFAAELDTVMDQLPPL